MTLLSDIDVGGTAFGIMPMLPFGSCATPAGSEVKVCTFSDSFELKAGCTIAVTFTYANTYGDGSTTYPKIQVDGASYPLKLMTGAYAATGAWANGQTLIMLFDGTNFIKAV